MSFIRNTLPRKSSNYAKQNDLQLLRQSQLPLDSHNQINSRTSGSTSMNNTFRDHEVFLRENQRASPLPANSSLHNGQQGSKPHRLSKDKEVKNLYTKELPPAPGGSISSINHIQDGQGTSDLAPKSMKRRNFKHLSLAPSQFTASRLTSYKVIPTNLPSNLSKIGASSEQRNRAKNIAPVTNIVCIDAKEELQNDQSPAPGNDHDLISHFSALELNVEFKLDLRSEDIQVLAELGSGNGGTVFKARHIPTGIIMARKVIPIEVKKDVRKQIVRELHIMHECNFPHIVSYYGAFLNEGDVVMCMEYMDRGSLDSISKKYGPIAEPILGKITEAVVEGLDYLYDKHRIIHRDVKPSNVLVNSQGQVKLCDFGVSGELNNSIADTFVGTSTYMSPERIQGAAYSVKSDVWSLGITLLELAIGNFPWDEDTDDGSRVPTNLPMGILDLLQRIVLEPPPKLPDNGNFTNHFRVFIETCLLTEAYRPTPKDLYVSISYLNCQILSY